MTSNATIAALSALALAGLAAPAMAETVLIGTQFSSILAYDTETGDVSFRGFCAGPVDSMTAMGDTLYLGDDFGQIYSFDLNTNQLVGSFPVAGDAAAMTNDGASLLVGDTAGEIQKIDPGTGAVLDSVQVNSFSLTSLGVHWGNLYHGGLSTVAERAPLAGAFEPGAFDLFAVCGGAINSMTFAGIDVVLGATNGSIYRYDEFNGTYANVHFVGVDAVGIAALTGGRVLVADSSGTLLEIDIETGDVLRETDAGEPIGALLALDVGEACPTDLDLSGVLDLGDVQLFIMLAIQGRGGADLNGDGAIDLTDVGMFAAGFNAGCD